MPPTDAELIARYEWRYSLHGTTRHAINSPVLSGRRPAVCGRSPSWFMDWYGTGNQREYERCENLPICKYCAKVIGLGVS